ncbi:MAG: hypothetical protein RR356_07460 [Bacteroidales bacterium]
MNNFIDDHQHFTYLCRLKNEMIRRMDTTFYQLEKKRIKVEKSFLSIIKIK